MECKEANTIGVTYFHATLDKMTNPLQYNQEMPTQISVNKQKNTLLIIVYSLTVVVFSVVSFYIGSLTSKMNKTTTDTEPISAEASIDETTKSNLENVQEMQSDFTVSGLVSEDCSKNECLFYDSVNDSVIGYAKLKGYYIKRAKGDWGGGEIICDSFVVQSGAKILIDNFKQWISEGNSINSLNEDGELVINIDLKATSSSLVEKIISSSEGAAVELSLIRNRPKGIGAGSCDSFVSIIHVD